MRRSIFVFLVITLIISCSKTDTEAPAPPPDNGRDTTKPEAPASTPVVRSTSQVDFTGVTTVDVPKPAGASPGDLVVVIMAKDGSTNSKPTQEEGWVQIVSESYGSGVPLIRAWWKMVVASDGSSYSFSPGSTSQSGRIDVICIKNWSGSAPSALATTVTSQTEFETPAIPVISPSGNDLMLTTVAVAAPTGLENVQWSNKQGFETATNLSVSKVTMSTAAKSALPEKLPQNSLGNKFITILPSSRKAAVITFIVPAQSIRPIIRVYRGGASRTIGAGGVESYATSQAVIDVLSDPALGYDLRSIGEKEVDKITTENLKNTAVYIQPGGPTIPVGWPYVQDKKELIKNYLDDGGKYLGICLGAYFLRNYYTGSSFDILPPGNFAYTYSSLAGSPYDGAGGDTAKVKLYDVWGSGERYLTISGACYFYCPLPVPDLTNLATYMYPDNGTARAAIRFSFNPNNDDKKGWVIAFGPHPEATDSWRPMEDPDGLDHDLIVKSVKDLLSR